MSAGATTTRSFFLPPPATADGRLKGWAGVERTVVASSLIVLISGLVAVSINQPKAELLFIGAGTVTLFLYFVVPPRAGEESHTIASVFLRRMPDVFIACGCTLIVLGIGITFPNQIALIPLFVSISFAALAALFGVVLTAWMAAVLYGAALVSLVAFVVLAFMA